jgi:SagB-type dehydrogenase family enzyme
MMAPNSIKLPPVKTESPTSIEKAVHERRSVRTFRDDALTLEEIGQLCWAGQGVTGGGGYRASPSAGALYPLEIYLVSRNVKGLASGVYHYQPQDHRLEGIKEGNFLSPLASAALNQSCVKQAPAAIVIAGVYERTTRKYRDRGIRYVYIEAGAAGENICLQAVSLGLGTVIVGAFDDKQVKSVVGLKPEEEPLLIIPVGR